MAYNIIRTQGDTMNRTATITDLIAAANTADTIALAFETAALTADDREELSERLCGIELAYTIRPRVVVGGTREQRVRLLAIIAVASRRVDRAFDAALGI